MTIIQP